MRSFARFLAAPIAAFALLFVAIQPAAAAAPRAVSVSFSTPTAGTVIEDAKTFVLKWSEAGPVRSREVTEYYARSSGSCAGLTWSRAWATNHASPYPIVRFTAGYCYRWSVRLIGRNGTTTLRMSPAIFVVPTKTFTANVWDGKSPNVQQAWNYTCVAASIQSELALALGSFDTSSAMQMQIYQWGRQNLGFALPDTEPGLDPHAWAEALKYFSGGVLRYEDMAFSDPQAALRVLATNLRRTGHAQGIAVKSGAHAWTVIGFTSTADPAATADFRVTGVYVMGPYESRSDPRAGTYYGTNDFVTLWGRYREPAGTTIWTGLYVIVTGG